MGSRRFNEQARSAFNVGFIQDLPTLDASFGVSYRKQGDAYERIVGEEVTISYGDDLERSEEHTSELQSLMRISYAVFCLKKKKHHEHCQEQINNEFSTEENK